jgi:hypothetical protein
MIKYYSVRMVVDGVTVARWNRLDQLAPTISALCGFISLKFRSEEEGNNRTLYCRHHYFPDNIPNNKKLYVFDHWEVYPDRWGVSGSSLQEIAITDTLWDGKEESIEINAYFTQRDINNIVECSPVEGGTAVATPNPIKFGNSRQVDVTVTATPNPGWKVKTIFFNHGYQIIEHTINDANPSSVSSIVDNDIHSSSGTYSGFNIVHQVIFQKAVLVKAYGEPDGSCTINWEPSYEETIDAPAEYKLIIRANEGYGIYKIGNSRGEVITFDAPKSRYEISETTSDDVTWVVQCKKIVYVSHSTNINVCGQVSIIPGRENGAAFFEGDLIYVSFKPKVKSTVLGYLDWGKWMNNIKFFFSKNDTFELQLAIDNDRVTPNNVVIRCEVEPDDGNIISLNDGTIIASSSSGNILSRSSP